MDVDFVYLKGTNSGIYYNGAIILACKDEGRDVHRNNLYELSRIIKIGEKNHNDLGLELKGCVGVYPKDSFIVTEQCTRLMEMKKGGLEINLETINKIGIDAELVGKEQL